MVRTNPLEKCRVVDGSYSKLSKGMIGTLCGIASFITWCQLGIVSFSIKFCIKFTIPQPGWLQSTVWTRHIAGVVRFLLPFLYCFVFLLVVPVIVFLCDGCRVLDTLFYTFDCKTNKNYFHKKNLVGQPLLL